MNETNNIMATSTASLTPPKTVVMLWLISYIFSYTSVLLCTVSINLFYNALKVGYKTDMALNMKLNFGLRLCIIFYDDGWY